MPRCKTCKEKFNAKYFNQKYCMVKDECIKAFSVAVQEAKITQGKKDWKVKRAVMKDNITTLADYKSTLQVIVNRIARTIDHEQPCISCGNTNPVKYDAGHRFTTKAHGNIRFNLFNIFRQCSKYCNVSLGGNPDGYDEGLENTFGTGLFEYVKFDLKNDYPILKASREDVKEAIKRAKEFERSLTKEKQGTRDRIELRIAANDFIGLYQQFRKR